ncbi:MAG: hypothetical protein Q4B57_03830 [Eubacteriales bacterium]|nr:hypothetical protein [Eubacteriales bacterium]
MKKPLISLLLVGCLSLTPMAAYADEKDDRIAELEAQIEELQSTIAELEEQLSANKSTTQDEYSIGETWVVEGQWKLTVDSVEAVKERNEFTDKNPAAVYRVTYTYENLGYESDFMDLYFSMEDKIIDADGKMGYSYPGDVTLYPQETPVGARCEAQTCIGVDNEGDFKLYVEKYDGNNAEHKAVFNITVQN